MANGSHGNLKTPELSANLPMPRVYIDTNFLIWQVWGHDSGIFMPCVGGGPPLTASSRH